MDNEVMELIDQLYTMVSEAWGVPLGNEKCIVERDQVLEILDEIKTAMPVELSEAKRLVSARDEFINNAKREAEGIRNQAEERARALVDDQEIDPSVLEEWPVPHILCRRFPFFGGERKCLWPEKPQSA